MFFIYKDYNIVQKDLKDKGYYLLTTKKEYHGVTKVKLVLQDSYGYLYYSLYHDVMSGVKPFAFAPNNPYTIDNINTFLKTKKIQIKCISTNYSGKNDLLEFVCLKCNTHIFKTWSNIYRTDRETRTFIQCPNCDVRLESLHALVLKQLFLRFHPDTIPEERSCINPNTCKVMPTDIVNHRLKIAIEIQSEWHDNKKSEIKDKIKEDFWINKGYDFYALDIRDYTILEMCQIFFKITKIPDNINFNYSNKINIKEIQKLLNQKIKVPVIADMLGINPHRIYDALQTGSLYYPEGYIKSTNKPVLMFDMKMNLLGEFDSIQKAADSIGCSSNAIAQSLRQGHNYSCEHFWFYKDEYKKDVKVNTRFKRFLFPVNKYNKNGDFVAQYPTIIEAAKYTKSPKSDILRVVNGERKSADGFIYKKVTI